MTKKVLFCATKDIHFQAFHLPYLQWFQERGYEVHTVASDQLEMPFVDKKFIVPIKRTPLHFDNIKAYKQLKEIIKENNYDIIHCHTPMGGVLARLAAKEARKTQTKVIYTAHGFHFCKGAPLLNWVLYYPIEKILASLTDCLITINREDYELAMRKNFQAKQIVRVHGVGVDTEKFQPVSNNEKNELRKQYGFHKNDFLLFYAAEFNKNKNQKLLIDVMVLLKNKIPNVKLLLAGEGPALNQCRQYAIDKEVFHLIKFLGFRNDIDTLLKISDIAAASSLREGLPVNIMEAMACGLPVVAVSNRGHDELVLDGNTGFVLENSNAKNFSEKVISIYDSKEIQNIFSENAIENVLLYSIKNVRDEITIIYENILVEERDETESKYNHSYL